MLTSQPDFACSTFLVLNGNMSSLQTLVELLQVGAISKFKSTSFILGFQWDCQ